MITAFYASFCALLIVYLSLHVISLRKRHQVVYGDGGHDDLQTAIRMQGNATEYIPITIVMMALLEWSSGAPWLLHIAGIALLIGRLIHASGLKNQILKRRVLGIRITLYLMVALSALNIFYFIAGYFFGGA